MLDDFNDQMAVQIGKEAIKDMTNEMEHSIEKDIETKDQENPFEHFEVFVNGKKVTRKEELENDERMFKDLFKGFDFGFNPLSVAQDVHGMNQRFEKRYNLLPDPKPGEVFEKLG